MNIEGQIHQKNPGMGQTPPLPGNARILDALVAAIPPLIILVSEQYYCLFDSDHHHHHHHHPS